MTDDMSNPMTPTLYRVRSRVEETADTVTLALEPEREPIAQPTPGQFNMLWSFGMGESAISLSAIEDDLVVHSIRDVGAVTAGLVALKVGDPVGLRGPFGVGWDLAGAQGRDVLVVGGGLGLAPVRPIVDHVLAHPADYGQLALLVGARSPDGLLYRQQLDRWQEHAADLMVAVTVDEASPEWQGHVGLVTELIDQVPVDFTNTTTFVCGPEIMMRFVAATVIDLGADPASVQLSLERNMHCAIGHCGRCQLGPEFLCKDGPVFSWNIAEPLLAVPER